MGWRLVDVDIHKVIKKLLHRFYIVLSTCLWKTKNGLRSLMRKKPVSLVMYSLEHSIFL